MAALRIPATIVLTSTPSVGFRDDAVRRIEVAGRIRAVSHAGQEKQNVNRRVRVDIEPTFTPGYEVWSRSCPRV